jgi:hypothetical protein
VIDIGDGQAPSSRWRATTTPLHRAVSGRGDRRRRHPARCLHHGRASDRQPQRAALWRPGPSEDPHLVCRRRRRHRRLRQLRRRADRRRRDQVRRRLQRQHPGQCDGRRPRRSDKIFYSRGAKGVGCPIVYVGSKTGRDGIHGATMASAEFRRRSEEKRPTVQVGDPFTEKLLIEACLELMASDAISRHSGHGRGGPHLLIRRDGRQGRHRHRAGPRQRAPARRPA